MSLFELEYTAGARSELEKVYEWIQKRAPETAKRWLAEFIEKVDTLREHPSKCPVRSEQLPIQNPRRGARKEL